MFVNKTCNIRTSSGVVSEYLKQSVHDFVINLETIFIFLNKYFS